jgi:hypothetical protein
MEAVYTSDPLVCFYKTTRCHVPEGRELQTHLLLPYSYYFIIKKEAYGIHVCLSSPSNITNTIMVVNQISDM